MSDLESPYSSRYVALLWVRSTPQSTLAIELDWEYSCPDYKPFQIMQIVISNFSVSMQKAIRRQIEGAFGTP